jgi:6-phosphogluconolactonase
MVPAPLVGLGWLTVGLLGAATLAIGAAPEPEPSTLDKQWVFVGTYTGAKSKGIYRFAFDPATGKLSDGELAAETPSPSFLAIAPDHRFLYAVNEVSKLDGGKPAAGSVSAYALDARTGKLTPLNEESSGGAGPCHLVTDRRGKNVLVANYGGGSVAVLPIKADGRVGKATAFVQHEGTSANPQRQEAPHAHSINVDRDDRFAFAADLGLDKVLVYRFDEAKGTLTPSDPPFVSLAPGAGPRHFAFHPTQPYAYVINELNSTVTAFAYSGARGTLTPLQSLSTLPKGWKGENGPADVQVHPSGKFLYGSNRGHDSIVTFTIDPKSGELTYVANQGEGIKTPRGFGIDLAGRFLIVGNQASDSLLVFAIDPATGKLKPIGEKVEVGTPVCVKFVARQPH